MPAKHPRLTITMDPSVHARLRRLSELTGQSQSALIGEMLGASVSVFDRMIRVLEAAQQARAAVRGQIAADLEGAQSRIEAQLGLVLDEFDATAGDLLETVEAVKHRAARSAGPMPLGAGRAERGLRSSGSTPVSNRGVRSQSPRTKVLKTQGGVQ